MKGIDVLYIPGPNMGYAGIRDKVVLQAKRDNPKLQVICGYAGEHELMYPEYADVIVAISAKFYPRLKEMYKNRKTPVVFLPESVDTEFFYPDNKQDNFTVGWSGRVADVKRCHLLDELDYKVVRQSNHGAEFFKDPNRSLDPMRDFYNSISALVLTSKTECMPRVVIEAMACGLPIVSTDVGSLRMVLDHEWLVPVNPEEEVVRQINEKLHKLETDKDLRKEVGDRNRFHIMEYFSWSVNQPMWDSFFLEVSKRHYQSVLIYNKQYREKYAHLEPKLMQ
jgi:glycosyltransferase involved in cell wall biosynthesis